MVNNVVIIGVTPTTNLIFNEEFPDLKKINVIPYHIKYSKVLPIYCTLFFNIPRIWKIIRQEHNQLNAIIEAHDIDVVISDNRFGMYNHKTENIYITHQLSIKASVFSCFANKIHHYFIKKYNRVWVPDYADNERSLAGLLSRNTTLLKKVEYIGPLTRLDYNCDNLKKIDYLFLLSGPEPLRTHLEDRLLQKAKFSNKKIVLIRGANALLKSPVSRNVTVFDIPQAHQLSQLIQSANCIICRSGYSTLMDLYFLKKTNLILIPTQGQSEQLYLAAYWQKMHGAIVYTDSMIDSIVLN